MSRNMNREGEGGRTMDASLKSYLLKRMREIKEEGRREDSLPQMKSKIALQNSADDIDTPSSLSESDDDNKKRDLKKNGPLGDNGSIHNNIQITFHRGKSRELSESPERKSVKDRNRKSSRDRHKSSSSSHRKDSKKRERRKDSDDRRSRKRSEDRERRKDSDDRDRKHSKDRERRKVSRDRSESRKAKHRSRSRSKSRRSRSRDSARSRDRSDERKSNRKHSSASPKRKKEKREKKKSKKDKKKKKEKEKEKKKRKKKRKYDEEDDAEFDENGEKIDYDFNEVDPEEFAEDGEVTEDDDSDVSDQNESESEEKNATDTQEKSDANDANAETVGDSGSDVQGANVSEGDDSDASALVKESAPTVEAIVAVSKVCKDVKLASAAKKPITADDVFERDEKTKEKPKLKLGIKLSDTSKTLISSGLSFDNKRKVLLEDGEVADSKSEKEKSSSDEEEVTKEKKKKKKKEKKRRRSVSRSLSRSPKRRRDEDRVDWGAGRDGRRRRSGSPGGRRRSRSPVSSRRWRSPSPRTRRRSRSPARRRSRSPAYYQWKKRDQMTREYRARPVHERLGRRRSPARRSPSLQIDKAALRAAAIKNTLASQAKGKLAVNLTADELARIRSGASDDAKELTEFCKKLVRKEGDVDDSDDEPTQRPFNSDSDEEEEGEVTDGKGGIVFNIKNAKQVPILTPAERAAQSAHLSKQFPVSSGSHHRKHEDWVPVEPKPQLPKSKPAPNMPKPKPEVQSTLSGIAFSADSHEPQAVAAAAQELAMEITAQTIQPEAAPSVLRPEERIFPVQARPGNIGELVTQRLAAMKRITENPNDVEAISQIYEANQRIEEWTASKVVPGQFHGSTDAKILTREELEGNKRSQCWARPDQFQTAEPVKGLGMFLLEKMGWKRGTGLGKNNEGPVEPLMLDLKNDRKGLISNEELLLKPGTGKTKSKPIRDLSEKHPISALMELCQRKKWPSPNFVEVNDGLPIHKSRFMFKVVVNGVEYQPTMGCNTKKLAKADAANVVLQSLGLVPRVATKLS